MDHRVPIFPIFYCPYEDPAGLYVLENPSEVEQQLVEDYEIEHGEYSAWDSQGFRLSIELPSQKDSDHSLQISVVSDSPSVDQRFLRNLVAQYGMLNKVSMKNVEGESILAFYKRIESVLEERRWKNRPWWRRLLGFANP